MRRFATVVAAATIVAASLGACTSEEARARKAWSSAVELTDLDPLVQEAAAVDRLGAEVVEELNRRNYGKARSKAVELGTTAAHLRGYSVPLAQAKLGVAHAFKFLAMREDARAVTEIEQAEARLLAVAETTSDSALAARLVDVADTLDSLPAQIADGRNVVRYRLEEAATKIAALLASGGGPGKRAVP